ncbi:MAG TPA: GNAT family N-acetyltransferase [Pseudonocardiaceae bacterium]
MSSVRLVAWTTAQLRERLTEALNVYVTAMAYPPGTAQQRAPMWVEHMARPNWRCVVALDERDAILGICYGYRGAPRQWWHEQVHKGLSEVMPPEALRAWMGDYFELTELHVRPDAQGRGLGEALLRHVLAEPAPAANVLLSTPEGPSRAWRLYLRVGFQELLRDYRFAGDPRRFAVLGRHLPL